ncbi:ODV-E28 [Homarus gammarus nudivirus]|uniref:ODV-E28 n=1 Tax=Homarus gammarus nudivirus TaxID=2509616 RepID=A0A411HBA0_9VIRU|nr:ODV-E28 [Homarus gammarus nudivirus]QBB28690.1 ODV-E28 [Homarus gammarus nudivirus]
MWHIWAFNGVVYLLNESNKGCPINYTPAVITPTNKSEDVANQVFKDVCVNKVFNDIVVSYKDRILPIIVDFDIETLQQTKDKFTILDALNFLFTKYITMDKVPTPESETIRTKYTHIDLNRIQPANAIIRNFSHQPGIPTAELNEKLLKVLQTQKLNKRNKQILVDT